MLLEEYAMFLVRNGDKRAIEVYRELLRWWPYELHNYRRFAAYLHETAWDASHDRNGELEESVLREAKSVLEQLLAFAAADAWAVDMLHKVESRIY